MRKLIFSGFIILIIAGIFLGTGKSSYSLEKSEFYTGIPECVQTILDRPGWLKPEVFSKTRISPPTGLALLLSSRMFAGTETIGITLPNLNGTATIYLNQPQYFDPFTFAGVSYWAHELKHAQQILELGNYEFTRLYLADYLSKGGYPNVSLEKEAGTFQQEVYNHLMRESQYNDEESWCLKNQSYSSNPDWKEIPLQTPAI